MFIKAMPLSVMRVDPFPVGIRLLLYAVPAAYIGLAISFVF
jgi:hypothetical protein